MVLAAPCRLTFKQDAEARTCFEAIPPGHAFMVGCVVHIIKDTLLQFFALPAKPFVE